MKILHIIDHWGLGGAQRTLSNIIALDQKNNHSVVAIYEHGKFDWHLPDHVKYLCKSYAGTLLGVIRLRAEIKKQNPEIIHIHLNGSRVLEFISSLGLRKKPVIIWHEHSGEELQHLYGPFWGKVITKAFKMMKRRVYFISNSSHTNSYLQNELEVPHDQMERILCPIDLSSLQKATSQISNFPSCMTRPGSPIIGFIGRLAPQKGLSGILDTLCPLLGKMENAQLWIVGEGPERKNLEKRVHHLGLLTKTVFWGLRRDVFSLIKNMDVVVMPSQYEPYGLVAMESLLVGTPVVGYSVGGLTAILENHPLGFPVPLNDKTRFSEAIQAALTKQNHLEDASSQDSLDTTGILGRLYQDLIFGKV